MLEGRYLPFASDSATRAAAPSTLVVSYAQGYINQMQFDPQHMMGKARVVFESAAKSDGSGGGAA